MLSVRAVPYLAMLLILGGTRTDAGEPSIERWDRAICLVESRTDAEGKSSGDAGSAFLLEDDRKLILVTAGHVARFTTAKSRVLFRDSDGQSHWFTLGGLTSGTGEPWRYHGQADLAAMEIDGGQAQKIHSERFAALKALAIPTGNVITQVPHRTTKIEIVGFPMLLGATPNVSPLVMSAEVASRELPVEAKWGYERIVFAHPGVANGTSGGPAFVTTVSPLDVSVMGMYMGYQQDNHGNRLSKLVPGQVILEFVRQQSLAEWNANGQESAEPQVQPSADAEEEAAAGSSASS